ncbi:MAG: hypothetical protein IKJ06_05020, partial [Clostridia bacterium]|nr:hypothetical protein [Clostridia bacterium]
NCTIPFLFGEIVLEFNGGNKKVISTDETFKVFLSEALSKNAPLKGKTKGPVEVWDMEKTLEFYNKDFDDTNWKNAKESDLPISVTERIIPYYKEKYIPARAVVAAGKGKTKKGFDTLHQQIKAETDEITLNHIYVLGSEGEFPPLDKDEFSYILVDFEKVRTGRISIDIEGYAGDVVDVVYADELFDGKPKFDDTLNRPISRFILKDGKNLLTTHFDCETFRYALLIVRNHVRISKLNQVGIFQRALNLENVSEFTTKNADLQRIWDMSINTLKNCVQDSLPNEISYYFSQDTSLQENSLRKFAGENSFYKDTDKIFCIKFVCSLADYLKFTGKTDLIKELLSSAISAMRYLSGFENQNGLLGEKEISAKLNLMYALALSSISALAKASDDIETERFFTFKARKIKKAIYKTLWNVEKGAYSDCMENGDLSNNISEPVNALALIVLHKKTDNRTLEIIKNVFQNKENVEISNPAEMTLFYNALHKIERDDIALYETLERFKGMLEKGATTVYEAWELENENQSACFGPASAPILFVVKSILGLDISGKAPIIKPMNDFDEFQAKIATPKGIFEIEK